jgi:protein phosphatase-4 regulatory subunit 3
VWTEANVTDMALSFQEPEGCAAIWEFVNEAQQRLGGGAGLDDGLSDELMDHAAAFSLPPPDIGNLAEVENTMRIANSTAAGRDGLAKFVVSAEYIAKLVPLVEIAEDLESLEDLHRLCNVMKTLILLNDTAIIESAVTDDLVSGVVGALEYDPDFPSHKANHRQYLSDNSRFKEVVKIEEPHIQKKIHYTYRLQYIKDVVLARILDDPTFSVLNSLIFFHQVDIVQHVQSNVTFLKELFGIFAPQQPDSERRKDAVIFIQQCCAIAKGLQANARQQLYQNFIGSGLFNVITFALKHPDASVRVAGTDILMALIDHDTLMMRGQVFKAVNEHQKPLTDILIELLLVEVDLGVIMQMADAIKILLDPTANMQSLDAISRSNSEFFAKIRNHTTPHADTFASELYKEGARKLFRPIIDLDKRESRKYLWTFVFLSFELIPYTSRRLDAFRDHPAFTPPRYPLLLRALACAKNEIPPCARKHSRTDCKNIG